MDLRKMGGRIEWGKSGGRGNCDLDVLFERNLFSIVKSKERKCLIKCHILQTLRLFYFIFCCKVELSFLREAIFKTPPLNLLIPLVNLSQTIDLNIITAIYLLYPFPKINPLSWAINAKPRGEINNPLALKTHTSFIENSFYDWRNLKFAFK